MNVCEKQFATTKLNSISQRVLECLCMWERLCKNGGLNPCVTFHEIYMYDCICGGRGYFVISTVHC